MGRGGKLVFKKSGGGGGGDWSRDARPRRGGGDSDDEEYVVGEEEEEEAEDESSDDFYSSDASREAEGASCSEEVDEEEVDDESDWLDENDVEVVGSRRPKKEVYGQARKLASRPQRLERSSGTDKGREMEDSLIEKPRARQRRSLEVLVEGEDDDIEEEDDDDEDFAPDEDDDDEEELATAPGRRPSGRRTGPTKRQKRLKRRNPHISEKKKRKKALSRKRSGLGSDDDDFIVKDRVSVDGAERKKKRLSKGRKRRRSLSPSTGSSVSSASDVDFLVSEDELMGLKIGGAPGHRGNKTDLSCGVQGGKKGKGKEIDEVGKRVCGICLSEEHNRVIRGLLDCCAHYFCFACIMEWSKVESKCPVCKRRFMTVSKSARSDAGFGLRTATIKIPIRDQIYQPSEEEIRGYLDPYANVVCLVCQEGGDDNLMLLCDLCDSSAHTYCVGLGREVPEGNWYCDGCRYTGADSSNLQAHNSTCEHGTGNNERLFGEFNIGHNSDYTVGCMSPVFASHSSTLSCQMPSQGTGQDTTIRCQTSSGDNETTSYISGFAASTLSGRRSIHQRIRIILSNSRAWSIPLVARNHEFQPSSLEYFHSDFETRHNGNLHQDAQEYLENGVDGRHNTSSQLPTVGMNSHTHDEGNFSAEAKRRVKSTVKRHLTRLTRETSLGCKDIKEIVGNATHTILAACGFQHRQSKVTGVVQVPSDCVHHADGDITSLVNGCCSSCFTSFVENVVQEILDLKLRSA